MDVDSADDTDYVPSSIATVDSVETVDGDVEPQSHFSDNVDAG